MPRERFLPTVIDPDLCQLCGRCFSACRNDAIMIQGRLRWVDYRKCTGCLTCTHVCPYNAIKVTSAREGDTLGIDVDVNKCTAYSGCQECVLHCPAGVYVKQGDIVSVNESNIKDCKACKACEEVCPVHAVRVVQA